MSYYRERLTEREIRDEELEMEYNDMLFEKEMENRTSFRKDYFFNDGTNEQNLWAYLYMECNDYDESHMLNAFQSVSGYDDENLHEKNVATVKYLIKEMGFEGFVSSFANDAGKLHYDYDCFDRNCFENVFYEVTAEAILDTIEVDESKLNLSENHSPQNNEKEIHKFGAAIGLIESALTKASEQAKKSEKPIERE